MQRSKWTLFTEILSADPKNLKLKQYIEDRVEQIRRKHLEMIAYY